MFHAVGQAYENVSVKCQFIECVVAEPQMH